VALPAFAAERRHLQHVVPAAACRRAVQQSIDISRPRGAQQQTRRTPLLLSIDGTDGQTDSRSFHRPCSTYCADSVKNTCLLESVCSAAFAAVELLVFVEM